MLHEPRCYTRKCKHFTGVYSSGADGEMDQVPACTAYPTGIPTDISYGPDLHLEVRPDQDNEIVYEREGT